MGCAAQMLSVAVTRAGGEVTGERAVTVVVLLQVRSHVRVDACARVDAAILGLLRLALDLAWRVMVCGWGRRVSLCPAAGGAMGACPALIEIWLPTGRVGDRSMMHTSRSCVGRSGSRAARHAGRKSAEQ